MLVIYAYAGFSLGVAIYFIYLIVSGLRTPEVSVGAISVNIFNIIAIVFAIFTLYVIFRLRELYS